MHPLLPSAGLLIILYPVSLRRQYEKKETILDIQLLHRRGLTQREISQWLGISRNTVAKYLNNPEQAVGPYYSKRKSRLDEYADNIRAWIEEDFEYKATWIYDRLVNLGFGGSYEIVKRKVRELKAERQQIAYIRFETEPGCQAQVFRRIPGRVLRRAYRKVLSVCHDPGILPENVCRAWCGTGF